MKKELVRIDHTSIQNQLTKLEAFIPQIELLREQARLISGKPLKSLSGESDVSQHLTLDGFPNATTIMASTLMGLESEYRVYKSNLSTLDTLGDYELNEEGKVSVKAEKIQQITDDASLFLSGKKLQTFKGLEKVCAELNKVNKALPNPIAHRLIQVDYNGNPSPNLAQILHG